MFRITDYVEFDQKGRGDCPCCIQDGKLRNKNLALVKGTTGAYKCHRGCTVEQIREVLGQPKSQQIPSALAAPSIPAPAKSVTITPQKVRDAHETLMTKSTLALEWLANRGFGPEMIEYYRLGVARSKVGDSSKPARFTHLPSIAIPIPANGEKTAFFHKKRVAPWLPEEKRPDGYRKWSQYGIPNQTWLTYAPAEPTETWLCEGEWDAMMLGWQVKQARLSVAVACFTCGCDNVPPASELAKLPGETVTIFYDRDSAGEKGQRKVAEALGDRARIGIVPAGEDCAQGWDVSDALNHGFTLDHFQAAAAVATPLEKEEPKKSNPLRSRLQWNDDLLDHAPDYTEWLVPDLLTANELFMLSAGPRTGKSLMSMTLAKAVAEGGTFLGRPVTQGTVLYVRCEDGDAKTKEREIAQGWSRGLPVVWLDRFNLSEVEHLREIALELDCRLLVLDTLSRIRDGNISETSAEMSQILSPLQDLAQDVDCCVLLVHHTGKVSIENAGQGDVFDRFRGNSSIRSVCRGSMILAAGERSYRLCVEHGWGKHDLNIVLDANTLTWRLLGNWNPAQNLTQQDQIIDCLKRLGVASLEQIHEETGIQKKSLYEQLSRLQGSEMAEEKVIKEGKRRNYTYRLALFNNIQQLNSVLNSANPVETTDTGYIQQNNNSQGSEEKGKSDHQGQSEEKDHFSMITSPPLSSTLVEYPHSNVDASTVSAIQHPIQHNSTSPQKVIISDTCGNFVEKGSAVEIYMGQSWKPGVIIRQHPHMVLSPRSRKLEIAFQVEYEGGRIPVAIDCLRIPVGDHHADG